VAHRWAEDWQGQILSVVFETRGVPAERPSHAAPTAEAAPSSHTAPPSVARAHATTTMQAIDLHCAGEPLRLIRSGFPQVPFAPILERRRWAQEHADGARRVAMHEPRGHRDM